MVKGTVTKVIDAQKRTGTSDKGVGWTIMTVEVEKEDGALVQADSFDTLVDGDVVELEPNSYTSPKTGKTYNGWNAKVPKAPRPGGNNDSSTNDVMQAIRMVFRTVKEVKDQNEQILAGVKALMGPVEDDVPEAATVPKQPETTTVRNWESVGQAKDPTPPEPTVEPIPEPPEDLEDFMNG